MPHYGDETEYSGTLEHPRSDKRFHYLEVGDRFEAGDEYGIDFCVKVPSVHTSIKPGTLVRVSFMCYAPRRRLPAKQAERRLVITRNIHQLKQKI